MTEHIRCNFCEKHQKDVIMIFAGNNHFICNECVALALEIVADKYGEDKEEKIQSKKSEIIKAVARELESPNFAMLTLGRRGLSDVQSDPVERG